MYAIVKVPNIVRLKCVCQTSASVYQDIVRWGGDPSCSRVPSFSGCHCNLSGNYKPNHLILAPSHIVPTCIFTSCIHKRKERWMCSQDLLVCFHIVFHSMEVKLLNLCWLKQQLPLAWARAWFALHRLWPWHTYRYKKPCCTICKTLHVNSWSVQLRKTWQSSCFAGVLMGQQHVWAAGSR